MKTASSTVKTVLAKSENPNSSSKPRKNHPSNDPNPVRAKNRDETEKGIEAEDPTQEDTDRKPRGGK